MPEAELDFRILGPLAVDRGGTPVVLGGPRQRVVLAYLVVHAGRVVPVERMVDEIWPSETPSTGTGPLRTYVSQLRRLLATGVGRDTADAATPVVRRPPGYLLDIVSDRVDADRFERQFAEARAAMVSGVPERALDRLDEALSLWRGPALGDLAGEPALQAEAVRLDEQHLLARELRGELLLATGQHGQAAAQLDALARAHPLRERLWVLLMTALYRSHRQSEALRCFQEARAHLAEGLGIEPGKELRDLEQAILQQDPVLDWQPPPGRAGDNGHGPEAAQLPATGAGGGGGHRPRHNLPRPLTRFVGRAAERSMVADALAESRLVTLCGSGGCGKTRLAVAAAGDLVERFPDGVWFVDLSAVSEPDLVVRTWAAVLGVESDQPGPLDHLCRFIGDDQALVVLDNCEHVIEDVAKAVDVVLSRCPHIRVLATSREELQLGAELVRRIGALEVPAAGAVGQDRAALLRSEAVQLFVERGRAALGGFAPTGDTLDDVAQICRRLDGVPLAIELAAALVGSLPVDEIADRLDNWFGRLDTGRRRTIARQRTLRDTLDWSFNLLTDSERELFVRLGVFVGDFTLTAAETVAARDAEPLAVVRDLAQLVAKSMVSCVSSSEGADRYRLLEIVRQYARERLAEEPGSDEVRRCHARYCAQFAAEAERHVHGAAACQWLGQVVAELPNLRAAVDWAFSAGDLETGLRLAGSLRWFFARMGLLGDAARWLDEGLGRRTDLSPDLRLQALTAATFVAFMQGDFSRTRELGEEGVAIARELDDTHQLAMALIARGGAAVYEGDLTRAEECFDEGGQLCRELGDRWGRAWMLTVAAVGSRRTGDHDRARQQAEESLSIFRALQDEHGQVLPLVNLALIAQEEGSLEDARAAACEAARLAIALLDRQLQHTSLCVLGRIEQSLDHPHRARELLVRSIRDYPGAHHHHMVAVALEGLAGLADDLGDHETAVALLAFTAGTRARSQISLSPRRAEELERRLASAEHTLGRDRLRTAKDRGRALDLDEAVRLAALATGRLATDIVTIDLVTAGAPQAGRPA